MPLQGAQNSLFQFSPFPEFFVCDGETIDPEDLCNYEWHCRDGSDEEDCGKKVDTPTSSKRGIIVLYFIKKITIKPAYRKPVLLKFT